MSVERSSRGDDNRQRRSPAGARVPAWAVWTWAVLMAMPVAAQVQTGTISGVVRDTSGAVLPGVTVEASSPALIEKVRSAVTDSAGVYRIINLTPGPYAVSFTLPGFRSVLREGLSLSAGVTQTVNMEMTIGGVEETITVTGAAPIVDVQNTTQHRVITREQFETLPTGGYWWNQVVVLPGVTSSIQDVGGLSSRGAKAVLSVHGSRASDMPMLFDGMRYNSVWGTGGGSGGTYTVNSGMVQELATDTSGATAEAEGSGVRVNVIPRQGGNRLSGANTFSYSNDHLQGANIDADLRARGVATPSVATQNWDVTPALGGPIVRNRAWFFFAYHTAGVETLSPGVFYDTDPADFFYTPDLSREQPRGLTRFHSFAGRVTLQTSARTKVALYADHTPQYRANLTSATTWDASTPQVTPRNQMYQASLTWTISNRLLAEAGQTWHPEHWVFANRPEVPTDRTGIRDAGLGVTYRAPVAGIEQVSQNYSGRAALSFVTGSHNLKVGGDWFWGDRLYTQTAPTDMYFNFTNRVPTGLTLRTTPSPARDNVKLTLGLFVQEQYTLDRLTFNAGLRFDHLNAYSPEQVLPAARFVDARTYARQDNLPNWKDVSPRLGVAYDLSGEGKTAIKASVGRYVELQAVGISELVNPTIATGGTTTTRAWNDVNGNFAPDCDLRNPASNGECGQNTNANFGQAVVTTSYAPGLTEGWGQRGHNWEFAAGIQHEFLPGLAVEASYHRRQFSNIRILDNTAVTPGDFDPYCVTSPVDARLPGGGGQRVCGLYDINPAKFGAVTNVWRLADDAGARDIFTGVDLTVNSRLAGGVVLQGGLSTGRTDTSFQTYNALGVGGGANTQYQETCFVVDSPQQREFCNENPPYRTQFKGSAIVPLPWRLQTSLTYQSIPGVEVLASWSAPNAEIAPSLGRGLAGGARTAVVQLITPMTVFEDRLNQLDLRVARDFRVGATTIRPQLSVFNVFNANTVLGTINSYGANWLRPTSILAPRVLAIGAQVNW